MNSQSKTWWNEWMKNQAILSKQSGFWTSPSKLFTALSLAKKVNKKPAIIIDSVAILTKCGLFGGVRQPNFAFSELGILYNSFFIKHQTSVSPLTWRIGRQSSAGIWRWTWTPFSPLCRWGAGICRPPGWNPRREPQPSLLRVRRRRARQQPSSLSPSPPPKPKILLSGHTNSIQFCRWLF